MPTHNTHNSILSFFLASHYNGLGTYQNKYCTLGLRGLDDLIFHATIGTDTGDKTFCIT